jgi:Tfp pilus assembly protein PilF
MDTYGWLQVLCSKVDEGIEMLRSANEIRQMADIHYHLGEAYLRKGFVDQASAELEKAMDMVKRSLQEKTQPDQALVQMQQKIEGAMGRAAVMQNGKKPTANAPISTNVP